MSGEHQLARADGVAPRSVLILAYYFPPMGLSGVQRTLKFAKYLSEFGWNPTVLTCEPGGYFAYDASLLEEVQRAGIAVYRTSSWDPTRLFGRVKVVNLPAEKTRRILSYLSQLVFVPDNKIGWFRPARQEALRLHAESPFDLIFSTAPPYSAHVIASGIAASTTVPLVLDFRDDWLGNPRHRYPTAVHRALSTFLERRALTCSERTVVINDVIGRNLVARNTDILGPENVIVIPQGYDPEDFRSTEEAASPRAPSGAFTLLYSGVFYDAQTPDPFLRALADLVNRRPELRSKIEAVFVGLLPEASMRLAEDLSITGMIRHLGYVPHSEAVAHLLNADVLWMMIGRTEGAESISTSKLYEYFGARKPILGIVPDGAAKTDLQRYGAAEIVDPDVISDIAAGIERLYHDWESRKLPSPANNVVKQYDRRRLTGKLAAVFDSVIRDHPS